MSRRSIEEYAEAVRRRYLASPKKGKRRILDEFCETTGYHRKAAIRLLRRPLQPSRTGRRGRPRKYGALEREALRKCWEASGRICSKRLAPFLSELVTVLERHRELVLPETTRQKLLGMGPSTIDRQLRLYRRVPVRRATGHPPTEAHIRRQVPIRTWGEWKNPVLGSVQADLVEHCGEDPGGFFLYSLTIIDVLTGWTECRPVWGKTMNRVAAAVHRIRGDLPMALREIHTDNGSEFLNQQLTAYCQREQLRFTRGRPYHKNDQAFVEQRNWTTVRQTIGYGRYTSRRAYQLMEEIYGHLRLYHNFFQPIRKLVSKERQGAKVTKRYDEAATPYRRLLATGALDTPTAKKLAQLYDVLNPVKLRQWIAEAQKELWKEFEPSTRPIDVEPVAEAVG